MVPPPGLVRGASGPRAAASRAGTCARRRRGRPAPGRRRGVLVGGGGAHRLPTLCAPRGAGAAVEGRFVCTAGAGMEPPGRQWSLVPPRGGQRQSSGRGAKVTSLMHAATMGPAAPDPALSSLLPNAPPAPPPPPPAPQLRSPALGDPRAAAHGRSVAGSESHTRPARLAPVLP